uniref:Magnesium-protoporphyrin IX methyltransferase C-terminal domain-containing protein n=1 Tax=Ananas comosus var. bracteatus TaxID=296719 RepID=A0A6V7PHQ6_ANACO|nr:unnamed protein product [Ananas comosus var. bracteatus]
MWILLLLMVYLAISPSSLLISSLPTYSRERRREEEEEEEEEEEKELAWRLWEYHLLPHFLTLVASSLRLKLRGEPTSTLLGFELGFEAPLRGANGVRCRGPALRRRNHHTATPAVPRHLRPNLHPFLSPLPACRRSLSTRAPALPSALDAPAALAAASVAAAAAAALSLSDPERRRQRQAAEVGGGDKEVVRDYFNTTGFERWRKIYGSSTEGVNRVQLDIRLGHSQTVAAALRMLRDAGPLAGCTVCDAGCGVGSLSIPLACEGALVSASDISGAMVAEAQRQAEEALAQHSPDDSPFRMPDFQVKDLESIGGRYDTVVCLDVLIHYPQDKAEAMIGHLASLAEKRLLLSFAPKTLYYDLLKRIGELFPAPPRPRGHTCTPSATGFVSTQFYFAKLVEAVPAGSA